MRTLKAAVCFFGVSAAVIGLGLFHSADAGVTATSKTSAPPLRGIMSFGWARNFIDSKSLDLPYISGMTAYFGWSDLETEDGRYDFSDIDRLVALAKAKGKVINLLLNPGNHAPEWLFRKGAKSFSWEHDFYEDQWKQHGKAKRWTAPLPWDPVFLEHWKRFITKLAGKYGSEPAVGYIVLTGPAVKGVTTNIVVKENADWNRLVRAGYSDEKVMDAWRSMVDHYQSVLPNKRLVLGVAPDRRGQRSVERARAIMSYIMQKRYMNISFMCVFLNDTWFQDGGSAREIRELLKQARKNGFDFGYQMAQSANRNAKWQENKPIVKSLRESLAIGVADGASWIEVWHPDIIDPQGKDKETPNPRYVNDLRWAQEALMHRESR